MYTYTHTLYYSILCSNKLSFPRDRSKQTREGIESALTREGDLHRGTLDKSSRKQGRRRGGETRFPRIPDEKLGKDNREKWSEFRRWLVTRVHPFERANNRGEKVS